MRGYIYLFTLILLFSACSNETIQEDFDHIDDGDTPVLDENIEEQQTSKEEVVTEQDDLEIKEKNEPTVYESIKMLEEFVTLNETVELTDDNINIVEDNHGKRIILIKDENGHETYKSIFIKGNNRLK